MLTFPALLSAFAATLKYREMHRSPQNEHVLKVLNFHHNQVTGVNVKPAFVVWSLETSKCGSRRNRVSDPQIKQRNGSPATTSDSLRHPPTAGSRVQRRPQGLMLESPCPSSPVVYKGLVPSKEPPKSESASARASKGEGWWTTWAEASRLSKHLGGRAGASPRRPGPCPPLAASPGPAALAARGRLLSLPKARRGWARALAVG